MGGGGWSGRAVGWSRRWSAQPARGSSCCTTGARRTSQRPTPTQGAAPAAAPPPSSPRRPLPPRPRRVSRPARTPAATHRSMRPPPEMGPHPLSQHPEPAQPTPHRSVGTPNRSAIRRYPTPWAFATSAAPITSTASPRARPRDDEGVLARTTPPHAVVTQRQRNHHPTDTVLTVDVAQRPSDDQRTCRSTPRYQLG